MVVDGVAIVPVLGTLILSDINYIRGG
jgi:hypothetical protein